MNSNELDELVAAAIAAEKWFTHQECVGNETLDTDAYQIADKLRGSLGLIETGDPALLKRAGEIQETFDDEAFLFGRSLFAG